jgi:hypothetical protein
VFLRLYNNAVTGFAARTPCPRLNNFARKLVTEYHGRPRRKRILPYVHVRAANTCGAHLYEHIRIIAYGRFRHIPDRDTTDAFGGFNERFHS